MDGHFHIDICDRSINDCFWIQETIEFDFIFRILFHVVTHFLCIELEGICTFHRSAFVGDYLFYNEGYKGRIAN